MSASFIDTVSHGVLRDWLHSAIGTRLGGGVGRKVFVYELNPAYVIKIEDVAASFQNVVEYEVWNAVKATTYARWFAPVRRISATGSILLMERTLPAPRARYPKRMPVFLGDFKYSNYGMWKGRIVVHDYGSMINFSNGILNAGMRQAKWWDANDGSTFNDAVKAA